MLGAYERIPARLIAVRMPEAIVNERRRQAHAVAKKARLHALAGPSHALGLESLHYQCPRYGLALQTVGIAYALRWQVELVFRDGKAACMWPR